MQFVPGILKMFFLYNVFSAAILRVSRGRPSCFRVTFFEVVLGKENLLVLFVLCLILENEFRRKGLIQTCLHSPWVFDEPDNIWTSCYTAKPQLYIVVRIKVSAIVTTEKIQKINFRTDSLACHLQKIFDSCCMSTQIITCNTLIK